MTEISQSPKITGVLDSPRLRSTSKNRIQHKQDLSPDNGDRNMSLKRNKSSLMEGYNVYKGPTSASIGKVRSQVENQHQMSSNHYSPRYVLSDWNSIHKSPSGIGHIPAFYYPDNLIAVSKHAAREGSPRFRHNSTQKNQIIKSHSLPFRGHVHVRPRPQSASVIGYQGSKNGDKSKGGKSKQTPLRGVIVPPFQFPVRICASSSKESSQSTDANTVPIKDTNPSISPQISFIPRPSYKLDYNVAAKPQQQLGSTPKKSILKNSCEQKSFLTIQPLKANHDLMNETPCPSSSSSRIESSNLASLSFPYGEIVPLPRRETKKEKTETCSSNRLSIISPPSCHITPATSKNVPSATPLPNRPMSAITSASKYELTDNPTPGRRKSVTFNSYVSLMSGNRISTIRSLSVDV